MLNKNIFVLALVVMATYLPLNSSWAKNTTNAGIYQAVLIPKPKKITYIRSEFELNARTVIVTDQSSLSTAEYLQTELRRLYNIDCRVLQNIPQKSSSNQISLQVVSNGKSVPVNNEGYALSVGKGQVSLKSKNTAGVFYGIQTLKQLLHHTNDAVVAQGCKITTNLLWPGEAYTSTCVPLTVILHLFRQ